MTVREVAFKDHNDLIALNEESVAVTSPMDLARLRMLLDLSALALVAEVDGEIAGFLIGMTDGCGYENGNYRWFAERLEEFLYVDRVVLSEQFRRMGIGVALYSRARQFALDSGVATMTAEMDLDPPNVGSLKFHEGQGFEQIGTRRLDNGKLVSMQTRTA